MSATAATCRTKARRPPALSLQEALDFINSLPYLVAGCDQKLLLHMRHTHDSGRSKVAQDGIYTLEFPVDIAGRIYTFPPQPFRIIRQITFEEYRRVLPRGGLFSYYYAIHTD